MLKTKKHTGEAQILGWPVDGRQMRESLSGQETNKLFYRILGEAMHKEVQWDGGGETMLGIKRAQERTAANINVRI